MNFVKNILSPLITLLNRSRTFKWDKLFVKKLTKQGSSKKSTVQSSSGEKEVWWKLLLKQLFIKNKDQDQNKSESHPKGDHPMGDKKRSWPNKFLRVLLFPFINPIARYAILFIVTLLLIGFSFLKQTLQHLNQ